MRETEQLPCQDARLRDEHQNMFIMPNMHDDQHATCMINIFSGAGGYLASISLSRLHRVGPNFELVCTTYSLDGARHRACAAHRDRVDGQSAGLW